MLIRFFREFAKQHSRAFAIVIGILLLGLIVIYGGNPFATSRAAGPKPVIARVDGEDITYADYRKTHENLVRQYRSMYGENFDQISQFMNFDDMAFGQLKNNALLKKYARDHGFTVSDADVRQYLFSIDYFKDPQTRVFSGERYRQFLKASQQTSKTFEASVAEDILAQKGRDAIREMAVVSHGEVLEDYKQQNEKAILEYALFKPTEYEEGIEVTDDEARIRFDQNQAMYRIDTRVKVKYIYLNKSRFSGAITPTDAEVTAFYEANKDTDARFKQEPEVRARHILIKAGENDPADTVRTAREKAERLLADIKAGADFATLARENSEDPGSGQNGGDLGFFGKGRMVPPFEQAAFDLNIGQVSGVVRSQFGFHIIKVEEKHEAGQKALAEVTSIITRQIKDDRGGEIFAQQNDKIKAAIAGGAPLTKISADFNLPLVESSYFEKGGTIPEVPKPQGFDEWAFSAKVGDNNGGQDVFTIGALYAELIDRIDAHPATFDEVKARIRDRIIFEKAQQVAKQKADDFRAAIGGAADWSAATASTGVISKKSKEFKRTEAIPEVGQDQKISDAIFNSTLQIGQTGPVAALDSGGYLVYRLDKFESIERVKFDAEFPKLEAAMLQRKQGTFLTWYLQELEKKASIEDLRQKSPEEAS